MDKFWENYIKTRPADSKGAFDEFKQMHQEPRITTQEPRIGLAGGGFLWKLLYKGKSGLQEGSIARKLKEEYIKKGMDKWEALRKSGIDASDIVKQKKLKIVQDQMAKTNYSDDTFVDLIDEYYKLTDYEMYKDIKRWDQTRPALADKTRAIVFPEWAETRYGDDYHTVLERGQTREIQQSIDPNIKEPLSPADQMASNIDEMNKANIAELFEGKKKHADGGRVGLAGGGGMDRRGFLKWLMGLAAGVAGGASGLFKTGGKKATEQVLKKGLEAGTKQFGNIEGMPAWFPRLISKIKEQGKLVEMADKDYVNGDIYSITLNGKKVTMEQNPLSGEIIIDWPMDEGPGLKRSIHYRPGETGFQRYGADPEHPFASENLEVEIEKPTFEYVEPDMGSMGPEDTSPDSAEILDIFTEGDDVVQAMENLAGKSAKELEAGVEIQSNKDFKTHNQTNEQFPDATWDESENITPLADYQYKQTKDPTKKAGGGTVETGDIARRQSLVPPLAGPNPQGIMGLPSDIKQVRVG
jgi:hypothetical protein